MLASLRSYETDIVKAVTVLTIDKHSGCEAAQVRLNVREDDEVDDEECGVEYEIGAADQDGAGPDAQLETRHHFHSLLSHSPHQNDHS